MFYGFYRFYGFWIFNGFNRFYGFWMFIRFRTIWLISRFIGLISTRMKNILAYLLISILLCWSVEPSAAQVTFTDVSDTHLPPSVLAPLNTMDARVVDLDNDGDLDIVLAIEFLKNVILLNDGSGKFEDGSAMLPDKAATISPAPYRYYPYHDSEDVAVGDFDQDGMIEIIIVTEDDETNEYYEMTHDGSYKDLSSLLPGTGVTNGLTSGDIDGDGWIDLILANNGQNYIWYNHGGKWIDQTLERLPVSEDITQDVELGDYDNDGDLDLLVANEHSNKLLSNDGDGVFTDISDQVFSAGINEETREADFGDVDGDGDLDIYFANVRFFQQAPALQRLLINEDGSFIDQSNTLLQLGYTDGTVDGDLIDIDQDGDLDLISGNGTLRGTNHGLTIALNNGSGKMVDQSDSMIGERISSLVIDVEVADFNGDGIMDIYLCCFRSPDHILIGK